MKNSWRDVTINEYFDLVDRLEEVTEEYEKEVVKISFVTCMPESAVWALPIQEFRKYQSKLTWLNRFEISKDVKFSNITIDGEKYSVDTNLQNFTVSQYIDFQTFYPKRKDNPKVIGNILACFIVPKGKTYADGYDIQKLVSVLNEKLDILTANEIMFFFLKQSLISTRAIANYFNWQMKRLKKKTKDKEKVELMEKEWEKMKRDTLLGLRSLTQ
jgi:hypothetical protein